MLVHLLMGLRDGLEQNNKGPYSGTFAEQMSVPGSMLCYPFGDFGESASSGRFNLCSAPKRNPRDGLEQNNKGPYSGTFAEQMSVPGSMLCYPFGESASSGRVLSLRGVRFQRTCVIPSGSPPPADVCYPFGDFGESAFSFQLSEQNSSLNNTPSLLPCFNLVTRRMFFGT
jgi:hypothetical protein